MSFCAETEDEGWHCAMCVYEGTESQVQGHIGGAHSRRIKPVRHGTTAGYRAERRKGMVSCGACKAAWRRKFQAYRANQRQRKVGL